MHKLAMLSIGIVIAAVTWHDARANAECVPGELVKLIAPDAATDDLFGYAVDISGNTAVIGAYFRSTSEGAHAGSAYVFVRLGDSWEYQAKLTASDAGSVDFFGFSVGVSGDTIVIGSNENDHSGGVQTGAVYVFTRMGTTWTQETKLIAPDAQSFDEFGTSVAIAADTVIVGAIGDSHPGLFGAGSAYVFHRADGVWTQQAKLIASDAASGDAFGCTVAISSETAVVGAYFDDLDELGDAGSAYVFVRQGSNWIQQSKMTADDSVANARFGSSVAVSGDSVLVGAYRDTHTGGIFAGSAYVFSRVESMWAQEAKLIASDAAGFDEFGISVAIEDDVAVVGADRNDQTPSDSGAAYVFKRLDTAWSEAAKLVAADATGGDRFGQSVCLSSDTAVIGAYFDNHSGLTSPGSAYVFDLYHLTYPADMDGNHVIDNFDVALFVNIILGNNDDVDLRNRADMDCSGEADGLDIQPFLNAVLVS